MSLSTTPAVSNNISPEVTIHHQSYPFIAPQKYTNAHSGKVVLVTGAGRGIGKSIALAFAASGASIAILSRTSSEISLVAQEIRTRYAVPCIAITGSVNDDASKIVTEVETQLGPIDILINNAGTNRMSPFAEEKNLDIWWRVFEVNLKGPVSMIHAVLPSFLARGKGVTITVGSTATDMHIPTMSAYTGSKSGLQRVIQTLDGELRDKGILNFYIHPGSVVTSLSSVEGNDEVINGPEMKRNMESFHSILVDEPQLAADSLVMLAANPDAAFLAGRFVDVNLDLEQVIARREEIEGRNLLNLTVDRL